MRISSTIRSAVSVVTSFIKSITIQMNIPRHLLTIDDAEILKNVVLHSVATAFASIVCNIRRTPRIQDNTTKKVHL